MSTPRKSARLSSTPLKSTPARTSAATPKSTPKAGGKKLSFAEGTPSTATPSSSSGLGRSASRKRVARPPGSPNEEVAEPEEKRVAKLPAKPWKGLPEFQNIYFIGTEWASYSELFAFDWDFSHLQEHLAARSSDGNTPYLFGQSEPSFFEMNGISGMFPVPVIILVDCAVPPPERIGSKSVQKTEEIIKGFRECRLSWVPAYGSSSSSLAHADHGDRVSFFYLNTGVRKVTLQKMNEEVIHSYDYMHPWIWLPHRERFDESSYTTARLLFCLDDSAGAKLIEIDWEDQSDEELFSVENVKQLMEEEGIPDTPELFEKFSAEMKLAVAKSKEAFQEARAEFKRMQASFSPAEAEALKNIHIIKFYPNNYTNATSPYVNRYYHSAHEVKPRYQGNDF
ncbi:MAG: hypothetical protein Q8P67_09590 [archaeon]|nr:hypothetical protein [archaeon]